jgi:hypothetical protein
MVFDGYGGRNHCPANAAWLAKHIYLANNVFLRQICVFLVNIIMQ